MSQPKALSILGTRGIPAAHGGFETLAEKLSSYLVERQWKLTVYGQDTHSNSRGALVEDYWRGVRRITYLTPKDTPYSTVKFDWQSVRHSAQEPSIKLVLGFNTAVFLTSLRLQGQPLVIHMDGEEWRRPKWHPLVRLWFYANFRVAPFLADRLILDSQALLEDAIYKDRLNKVHLIAYGADSITAPSSAYLKELGLTPDRYFIVIARIEPDNSILEIVTAFSSERRGYRLVVLGNIQRNAAYRDRLLAAASSEVVFVGAIYDRDRVQALRFYARAYIHGHQVGGTNPSLVEALWAGNAVIAHRNRFNEWTAGTSQLFFSSIAECSEKISEVIKNEDRVSEARVAARERAHTAFSWSTQLEAYEKLLTDLWECSKGSEEGK